MPDAPVLKPVEHPVYLLQADDLDRRYELLDDVQRATEGQLASKIASLRLGDDSDTEALAAVNTAAKALNAFMDKANRRAAKVLIRPLPRKSRAGLPSYRDLVLKHPPREDDERDKARGFNVDAMADDLVPHSIVDGQFATTQQRDDFLDGLSEGYFTQIFWEAINLNERMSPDPKARLPLQPVPTSGETSQSPARSGEA
jgi:hypothetical protein